ncbi:hypothetical protein [Bradyrhizobium lablabi]|uniref:hypothetical protein n=1 Tax=Bradyrhizobium lablabi TaxID=722472 RepID=UPI001BA585EA|nr:hypothetical protein [Bradyrhizobium lablabi]MBR0693601.1 hypothetical protein [Bradyrhizobium lablabi]
MTDKLPLARAARRRILESTVEDTLPAHGLNSGHLVSPSCLKDYVEARVEVAQKLHALGFKRYEIASAIGRDPSTVSYYLNKRARKLAATLCTTGKEDQL